MSERLNELLNEAIAREIWYFRRVKWLNGSTG